MDILTKNLGDKGSAIGDSKGLLMHHLSNFGLLLTGTLVADSHCLNPIHLISLAFNNYKRFKLNLEFSVWNFGKISGLVNIRNPYKPYKAIKY